MAKEKKRAACFCVKCALMYFCEIFYFFWVLIFCADYLKKVLLGGAKIYSDFPVKRKVTIISFTCRCVFMQKNVVNTPFFRRKVCQRTYFSYKKSMQKNFPPNTPLCFNKAIEVPRNFSRKVSCVRVWGGSPDW